MIAFEYSSYRKQLLIGQKRERSQLLLSCLFQHPPPRRQSETPHCFTTIEIRLPLHFLLASAPLYANWAEERNS